MTKVVMYTLSYCPWCKKTKKFFSEHNIPYKFIDYDLASDEEQDRIAKEIKMSSGTVTFPFVKMMIRWSLDIVPIPTRKYWD